MNQPYDCPFDFCPNLSANERALQHWRAFVRKAIARNKITVEYECILTRAGRSRFEALARIVESDPSASLGDRLVPAGKWIAAVHSEPALSRAFDWHMIELVFRRGIPEKQQIWINLTNHTIKSVGFVERFQGLMERYDIASEQVAVEATEQSAGNGAALNLSRLHNMVGVAIVVDDLGSGYSNLLALTRLPLYAIKLDGKLIQSYRDPRTADLIKMFAAIARKWRILCVAEWVEDSGQMATLWGWGITAMQGYAIK